MLSLYCRNKTLYFGFNCFADDLLHWPEMSVDRNPQLDSRNSNILKSTLSKRLDKQWLSFKEGGGGGGKGEVLC